MDLFRGLSTGWLDSFQRCCIGRALRSRYTLSPGESGTTDCGLLGWAESKPALTSDLEVSEGKRSATKTTGFETVGGRRAQRSVFRQSCVT